MAGAGSGLWPLARGLCGMDAGWWPLIWVSDLSEILPGPFGPRGDDMRCRSIWVPLVAVVVAASAGCGAETSSPTLTSTTSSATLSSSATTVGDTSSTAEATGQVPRSAIDLTVAAAMSELGKFAVGRQELAFTDPARNDRSVGVTVYYPAERSAGGAVPANAAPDSAEAPYPVIVGSGMTAGGLGSHLASHGFVVIGARSHGPWGVHPSPDMIDFPLDLTFALDAVEALDPDPLAAAADTDQAGVVDYSFGSWTAIALGGARIDPDHYASSCNEPPADWSDWWFTYVCEPPEAWERLAVRASQTGIATSSGLWNSLGDDRIKAAMPVGPEGYDLVGPDGLSHLSIPVLYTAAGEDTGNPYELAAVPLFERGQPDTTTMITFEGAGHYMVRDPEVVAQIRRFALAFFTTHLKRSDEYQWALTHEFIENYAAGLGKATAYESLTYHTHK